VHVQNFFPNFSPSVHRAAYLKGVPSVQAIRNYRLFCVSANLYRNDKNCSDCVGRIFALPGVVNGCYRKSRAASAVVATMQFVHKVKGTWSRDVVTFIALTKYVKDKLIESGVSSEKIRIKPNFVSASNVINIKQERNGVVYVGRMTHDKGIDILIAAWLKIETKQKLFLIGEGYSGVFTELELNNKNIYLLGRMNLNDVYEVINKSLFLVMPVRWAEPFGRVVVEAYAQGTPVISANAGGLKELVDDGVTGLLFEPGNCDDLSRKISFLLENEKIRETMGSRAFERYENMYSQSVNLDLLLDIYQEAINKRRG
jgi:glycosyltransferase involved in cell wall biosynthesis